MLEVVVVAHNVQKFANSSQVGRATGLGTLAELILAPRESAFRGQHFHFHVLNSTLYREPLSHVDLHIARHDLTTEV